MKDADIFGSNGPRTYDHLVDCRILPKLSTRLKLS